MGHMNSVYNLTAITKLNSILWDGNVTPKTKTHIYHAIVKSKIAYAAETGCLKVQYICGRNMVFKSTITYGAETSCTITYA